VNAFKKRYSYIMPLPNPHKGRVPHISRKTSEMWGTRPS
jgi:hypothetical protein